MQEAVNGWDPTRAKFKYQSLIEVNARLPTRKNRDFPEYQSLIEVNASLDVTVWRNSAELYQSLIEGNARFYLEWIHMSTNETYQSL